MFLSKKLSSLIINKWLNNVNTIKSSTLCFTTNHIIYNHPHNLVERIFMRIYNVIYLRRRRSFKWNVNQKKIVSQLYN